MPFGIAAAAIAAAASSSVAKPAEYDGQTIDGVYEEMPAGPPLPRPARALPPPGRRPGAAPYADLPKAAG